MTSLLVPQGDRRSRRWHQPLALLETTPQVPLVNLLRLLVIACVMDGRGVVPTLSSSDVETAAQVLHSVPPSPASH